jgi:hypothetical protein
LAPRVSSDSSTMVSFPVPRARHRAAVRTRRAVTGRGTTRPRDWPLSRVRPQSDLRARHRRRASPGRDGQVRKTADGRQTRLVGGRLVRARRLRARRLRARRLRARRLRARRLRARRLRARLVRPRRLLARIVLAKLVMARWAARECRGRAWRRRPRRPRRQHRARRPSRDCRQGRTATLRARKHHRRLSTAGAIRHPLQRLRTPQRLRMPQRLLRLPQRLRMPQPLGKRSSARSHRERLPRNAGTVSPHR